MKLLALSDLHGNYSYVKEIIKIAAGNYDVILIAGDITNFGPNEKAIELLSMFDKPILAVPGNCDKPDLVELLEKKSVNLHKNLKKINNITFIGHGGSNSTPFNTPFEFSEKKLNENIGRLLCCQTGKIVLLSHAPPHNTTDKTEYGNVGSKSISRYLGRFDLIVCGHIHEARGCVSSFGTVVVNPGTAANGEAALITMDDEISVEFIDIK